MRSIASALEHAALRRILLEAGRELGVREYGYNALLSLRLEKSFGIWSAEFTQAYTPRMTGMDRWIAWEKGEFLGRKRRSRRARVRRRSANWSRSKSTPSMRTQQATSRSGAQEAWPGFVTSGGYGHTIGKSLAMALVAPEAARSARNSACILSAPSAKHASSRPRRTTPRARRCGHDGRCNPTLGVGLAG